MALTKEREIRQDMLAVRTSRRNGAWVVSLEGELDLANANVAEAAVREAMADESMRLVIDMHGLTFIDSTGIALLVSLIHADQGSRLRFVPSTAPEVVRVLQVTGIEQRLTGEKPSTAPE
jgi:anti-sigma B factor antagonist